MRVSGIVFVSICSSESAGIDNAHHHDVSDGGDDGDPEPNGIAGHRLRLVLLAMHRGCRGGGVDTGWRVEERVLAAVVVIRRGVHEGSRHYGDLGRNYSGDRLQYVLILALLVNLHLKKTEWREKWDISHQVFNMPFQSLVIKAVPITENTEFMASIFKVIGCLVGNTDPDSSTFKLRLNLITFRPLK